MVFKWNEQSTLLFLEHFKNYQCLWNHKLDEYKDRTLRANAMKSLISDLNLEVCEEDIKHKIKTIRTRFTTELTKIKQSTKSGRSTDDIYVPMLYWFKHAEFLSSVCIPRQSTSNLDTSVNTQTQNEDSTESEPKSSQAGSEKQSKSSAENSRNGGTISSTSLYSEKPVNRKRKTDIPIDMAIKELKAISKENKEQVEDEFDLFCKSLAIQLKKMPLNRALICQERLQSVMTQERLAQMTSLSESSSSTRSSLNIDRSHQYETYHSPTQQVYSPTQQVYSPTVSDHYYPSETQQELHSQIVLPPSTQENILIQALKDIV
ncbi:uncharacterized protein [Epargyreus clarus]|uniref:uncharacterized protein n=1 Tax=Epargyreus clarus TaxID=520877 RepID=UPI003C2CCB94